MVSLCEVNGAFGEGDDRLFPAGATAREPGSARSFELAHEVEDVDGFDLHTVDFLNRSGDFQLGGFDRNAEGVFVLFFQTHNEKPARQIGRRLFRTDPFDSGKKPLQRQTVHGKISSGISNVARASRSADFSPIVGYFLKHSIKSTIVPG